MSDAYQAITTRSEPFYAAGEQGVSTEVVALAVLVVLVGWIITRALSRPDPPAKRHHRYVDMERRHGTKWLERVHRSDFLSDAWGDYRDVDIHDYAKWRKEQGRPIGGHTPAGAGWFLAAIVVLALIGLASGTGG